MNLIQKIALLIKIEKLLKNSTMKNWKTTLAGVLGIVLVAAPKVWPNPLVLEICTVVKDIAIASGLLVAADATNNSLNDKAAGK